MTYKIQHKHKGTRKMNTIKEVIEDIKNGKMIILLDDEDRENEGDLVMAAEKITPEALNFMVMHARGLVCMPLDEDLAKEKDFHLMTNNNTDAKNTNFTISIDYKYDGVTTGISAYDRAKTIEAITRKESKADDFSRPGHIFPLIARKGGVLVRAGHTEAAVDLSKLAGFGSSGVICEIMNDDGTMSRLPELEVFSKKYDIKMATIKDLIEYRTKSEKLVICDTIAKLPTNHGDFEIRYYMSKIDSQEHIALVKGDVNTDDPILVRVHSECLTGDALGSKRCDCGEQLDEAMRMIAEEGRGVIIYMRQEGRGIGLRNKLKAYHLQDNGYDTVEANEKLGFAADLRNYGIGAQMIVDLGIKKIRLMTNNPKKIIGLQGYGIEKVERVPIVIESNESNAHYLDTKKKKMGHII